MSLRFGSGSEVQSLSDDSNSRQKFQSRASKYPIYFQTRVRVFSGPAVTGPGPDPGPMYQYTNYQNNHFEVKIHSKIGRIAIIVLSFVAFYEKLNAIMHNCVIRFQLKS